MLSVLIPIYNQDVTKLVRTLQGQLQLLPEGEIICLDDGSELSRKEKNRHLSHLKSVHYRELPENIGRAAIRNQLASMSHFPYLLFLDGDSEIVSEDFLAKYWQQREENKVVVGGRVYPKRCPNAAVRLHWTYGTQRERQSESGFQSNNFLIRKSVFTTIRFDESIRKYGHEDTIFGYHLEKENIPIKPITNPVLHASLETTDTYLIHQIEAIQNLKKLRNRYPDLETRLTKTIDRLQKYGLCHIVRLLFKSFEKAIESNLRSENPNLNVFDFFKIGRWLYPKKKKKKRPS